MEISGWQGSPARRPDRVLFKFRVPEKEKGTPLFMLLKMR